MPSELKAMTVGYLAAILGAIVMFLLSERKRRSPKWRVGTSVVITGASSGIGTELARIYAARGSRLLLTGRDEDRLVEVAAMCKKIAPPSTEIYVCTTDLTSPADRRSVGRIKATSLY